MQLFLWWAVFYILIAGGPCTGKTTLTNLLSHALREKGFRVYVIRDWARELIKISKEGKENGGPLPWTDRVGFEVEVARRHLNEFKQALKSRFDVIIEDSGSIATIAYCKADGVKMPSEIVNEIIKHSRNIDLVLITEPNSDYMKDAERWEERSYALKIHKEIIKIHKELLKDKVIILPSSPTPKQRLQNVLNVLSAKYPRIKARRLRT